MLRARQSNEAPPVFYEKLHGLANLFISHQPIRVEVGTHLSLDHLRDDTRGDARSQDFDSDAIRNDRENACASRNVVRCSIATSKGRNENMGRLTMSGAVHPGVLTPNVELVLR